ncbi:c-type cytochrome [Bacteriovoracaceae bacterium]|nr:c-type cytochrome [Bacteriovoracaceae bacterium]|tara:strand:+ start:432705 stop:433010 length:306 start_codon:yes stop_codon:yes gene_type:complete
MKILVLICSVVISLNIFSQDVVKGQALYSTCIQCHGEKGLGLKEKEAPMIAGQYDWYIESSIIAFREGKDRKNPAMLPYIKNLSVQDIKDLAAYVSKMPTK